LAENRKFFSENLNFSPIYIFCTNFTLKKSKFRLKFQTKKNLILVENVILSAFESNFSWNFDLKLSSYFIENVKLRNFSKCQILLFFQRNTLAAGLKKSTSNLVFFSSIFGVAMLIRFPTGLERLRVLSNLKLFRKYKSCLALFSPHKKNRKKKIQKSKNVFLGFLFYFGPKCQIEIYRKSVNLLAAFVFKGGLLRGTHQFDLFCTSTVKMFDLPTLFRPKLHFDPCFSTNKKSIF